MNRRPGRTGVMVFKGDSGPMARWPDTHRTRARSLVLNGLVALVNFEMGPQLAEHGADPGELSPRRPHDQLFSLPFDLDIHADAVEGECFRDPNRLTVPILKQSDPSGSVGCTGLPLSEGIHGHIGPPLGCDSILAWTVLKGRIREERSLSSFLLSGSY